MVVVVFLSTLGANCAVAAPDSNGEAIKAHIEQGLIDLQEYKQSMFLTLDKGQARLIRLTNAVTRTSISDPSIAEPVVLSECQIALVAKTVGHATLTLWDVDGNVVHIGLRVKGKDELLTPFEKLAEPAYHVLSGEISESRVPIASVGSIDLEECSTTRIQSATDDDSLSHKSPSTSKQPERKPNPPPWSLSVPHFDSHHTSHPITIIGTIEPCQKDTTVHLEVPEAKVYRVDHALTKWSVSDPTVSEPVIVSDREIVLLGKKSGRSVIGLWDEAGNKIGIEARVRNHQVAVKSIFRFFAERIEHHFLRRGAAAIPAVVAQPVEFQEIRSSLNMALAKSQATLFKTQNHIVRLFTSDPTIVDLIPSEDGLYIWGKSPGRATAFLWDDQGNIEGVNLHVTASQYAGSSSAQPFAPGTKNPLPTLAEHSGLKGPFRGVECWAMTKKTVWEFPGEESSFFEHPQYEGTTARCINFNNEGVKALNDKKYELAITKFLESLEIDSKYQLACDNLATTYNNYGLTLRERPKEAIKKFHLAFCLDPISKIALLNIEGIIRVMGMDPNSFNDRIILAEQAAAIEDLAGSVIEYQAALQIKNDPAQRHKLIDALKRLQNVSDQLPLKLFRPAESEKALAGEPIDQRR